MLRKENAVNLFYFHMQQQAPSNESSFVKITGYILQTLAYRYFTFWG